VASAGEAAWNQEDPEGSYRTMPGKTVNEN
jgi:hypothetical protein